jgi:hypothetical protein
MDVDNETGEEPGNYGILPGHVYGWYAGKIDDNSHELLAEGHILPTEMITKEVIEKGVFAAVANAKTFGIKVSLKFI